MPLPLVQSLTPLGRETHSMLASSTPYLEASPWKEAVEYACRLAGTKCCSPGYDAVRTLAIS